MSFVNILLDDGADLHAEMEGVGNVLHVASFGGQTEVVRFLLARGFDVNAPGGPYRSALIASLHQSHEEITRILVEAGASLGMIDSLGRTALYRAVKASQATLVGNLVRAGANVFALDKQKCSALHHSAMTGSLDTTELLVLGISVLHSASFGWSPLHWAARGAGRHDAKAVEVLLTAGASKEATDSTGMTPFEFAVFFQHNRLRSNSV